MHKKNHESIIFLKYWNEIQPDVALGKFHAKTENLYCTWKNLRSLLLRAGSTWKFVGIMSKLLWEHFSKYLE